MKTPSPISSPRTRSSWHQIKGHHNTQVGRDCYTQAGRHNSIKSNKINGSRIKGNNNSISINNCRTVNHYHNTGFDALLSSYLELLDKYQKLLELKTT